MSQSGMKGPFYLQKYPDLNQHTRRKEFTMTKKVPHRFYLTEEQMPKQWYNLRADMKEKPEPLINPATGKPAELEDLLPVFCKELAVQEMERQGILISRKK